MYCKCVSLVYLTIQLPTIQQPVHFILLTNLQFYPSIHCLSIHLVHLFTYSCIFLCHSHPSTNMYHLLICHDLPPVFNTSIDALTTSLASTAKGEGFRVDLERKDEESVREPLSRRWALIRRRMAFTVARNNSVWSMADRFHSCRSKGTTRST